MSYNVIVTKINNPRSKTAVSRVLAQRPEISLQLAVDMVENLPVAVEKNLTKSQLVEALNRYKKMGVEVTVEKTDGTTIVKKDLFFSGKEGDGKKPELAESRVIDNKGTNTPPKTAETRGARLTTNKSDVPSYHAGQKIDMAKPLHSGGHRGYSGGVIEPPAKKKGKKIGTFFGVIGIIGVIIAIVMLSRYQKKESFKVTKNEKLISKKTGASSGSRHRGRPSISKQARRKAQAYCDSALTSANTTTMIKFYKIAISFNKYNTQAWYGLINAYREAGMVSEARKAKEELEQLLGKGTFTLVEIIKPFGELVETEKTPSGTLRLHYVSRVKGKDPLLLESFRVGRGLTTSCGCKELSLFASTAPSKGLLVHITAKPYPENFSAFKQKAKTTYLE